jgi:hypothetical protein
MGSDALRSHANDDLDRMHPVIACFFVLAKSGYMAGCVLILQSGGNETNGQLEADCPADVGYAYLEGRHNVPHTAYPIGGYWVESDKLSMDSSSQPQATESVCDPVASAAKPNCQCR